MGNLSGESREQNRQDKVTRFRSVTYARQLGLLVNTLGSHLFKWGPFSECHQQPMEGSLTTTNGAKNIVVLKIPFANVF